MSSNVTLGCVKLWFLYFSRHHVRCPSHAAVLATIPTGHEAFHPMDDNRTVGSYGIMPGTELLLKRIKKWN